MGRPAAAWNNEELKQQFEAEVNQMLEVPVITAVHSDSWLKKLDMAILRAQHGHWDKQIKRLTALREAIRMARTGRREA